MRQEDHKCEAPLKQKEKRKERRMGGEEEKQGKEKLDTSKLGGCRATVV